MNIRRAHFKISSQITRCLFTCIIKIINSLTKYLLTDYYIPSHVWDAETTTVNRYIRFLFSDNVDRSNANINKSTRKCHLMISTTQRGKIGCCDKSALMAILE